MATSPTQPDLNFTKSGSNSLEMCTLKSLRNGDLICNEFESWDLILLDRNLNEKQRLMGAGNGAPGNQNHPKTQNIHLDRLLPTD